MVKPVKIVEVEGYLEPQVDGVVDPGDESEVIRFYPGRNH